MDLSDYSEMKKSLFIDLVGSKQNQGMLAEAPHTDFEDLSMVYRIRVPVGEDSFGSVLISNSMLERFGVDKEQLHQDALENAPQIRPATVRSMGSVLGMLGAPPGEDSTLLVLTTEDMFKGAAALFYPDMMQSCSRMLKQDYFILPSSVHEVLLLPDNGRCGRRSCSRWSRRSTGQ